MDEGSWTEQTGKVERVGWGVIKWTIYVFITLLLFGAAFWFLFYSDYLANNYSVISARNWYQESYRKIKNLPIAGPANSPEPNPIYSIQAQTPLKDGLNTYTLVGTFLKLDVDNSLIFLSGNTGKVYTFRIDNYILKDLTNSWLVLFKATDIKDLSSSFTPLTSEPGANNVFTESTQISLSGNIPDSNIGLLGVRWNDQRTLSQITADYAKDPTRPLNETSVEDSIVVQFK